MEATQRLQRKIRTWITLFMILLLLSGITAFPLEWELELLRTWADSWSDGWMKTWIVMVHTAIAEVSEQYPFMAYGTDWLAFAHIVIATAFIGPWRDPVRNIWVIQFGMIACIMVFPLALIAGPIRGIPFLWQLIDCSFGVFGFIPLWVTYKDIKKLATLTKTHNTNKTQFV